MIPIVRVGDDKCVTSSLCREHENCSARRVRLAHGAAGVEFSPTRSTDRAPNKAASDATRESRQAPAERSKRGRPTAGERRGQIGWDVPCQETELIRQ